MNAARKGHHKAVIKLIELGANCHMENSLGDTALHIAVFNNHSEIAEYLIANGALINQKNRRGETALHKAVMSGRIDGVKALVKLNADIFSVNNAQQTPMQVARRNSQYNILRVFRAEIDDQLLGIYQFLKNDQYSFDIKYSVISFLPMMRSKSNTAPDKSMLRRYEAIYLGNNCEIDDQEDVENDAEIVEQLGRLSLFGS